MSLWAWILAPTPPGAWPLNNKLMALPEKFGYGLKSTWSRAHLAIVDRSKVLDGKTTAVATVEAAAARRSLAMRSLILAS